MQSDVHTCRITSLAKGRDMEVLRFDYGPGDSPPAHCHPYPQTGFVQSGRYRLWIEGAGVQDLRAGGGYVVPADAEHTFEVMEPGVVIVSTHPDQSTYVRGQS